MMGIASAITGLVQGISPIIDEFHTSDEERGKLALEEHKLRQEDARIADASDARQVAVNKLEAKSSSLFKSGWRPGVGWVCVVGLAYNFIVHPLFSWGLAVWAPSLMPPPSLDIGALMPLLMGMLGLGGLRTFEKVKKVAAK